MSDPSAGGTPPAAAPLSENQVKHLEFAQAAISRMAANSFLVKGWSATLATGVYALALGQSDWRIGLAGLIPVLCFWLLDGFYLRQERLYRLLYEDVRQGNRSVAPFSMNIGGYLARAPLRQTTTSQTLTLFHGALCLGAIVVTVLAAL